MKSNNIFLTIALVFLIGLSMINFFRKPGNLVESKKILEEVQNQVAESGKIIENQAEQIRRLQQLNNDLAEKINRIDSVNSIIRKNIDVNLGKANRSINEIKKTIDDIKPLIIE